MGKGTEIMATLGDYAISRIGNDAIGNLIQGNLGGSMLQINDLPKVKIPAGGSTTWLVPPDDAPSKEIEGIVIYQHPTRAMFVPSENGAISNDPPLCVADDGAIGRGMPGGDCLRCVNAAWGSAGAGKKGQACKSMQRIYILSPASVLPLVLTLSPSSLASWRKYMISLINTQRTANAVVTRIALEKVVGGPAPYARIVPSFVRALTDDEKRFVDDYASGIIPVLRAAPYAVPEDEVLEAA